MEMFIFEREMGGRQYRIAAESVWDSKTQAPVSRQVVLGPAGVAPTVNLSNTKVVGSRRVGDVGALGWVAEQLNLVQLIDEACGSSHSTGPSVGELALAVAVQRACAPGAKNQLAEFLGSSVARLSCLPAETYSGQAFYRAAAGLTDEQLEHAQLLIARAAVKRFGLSADVLAFDSTNFDTHIATTTEGGLARRGHAKSKRSDLRVVGLGVLVSETGHVPLLHRVCPGNGSDQALMASCMAGLSLLHEELDAAQGRKPGEKQRTMVRDGGFWSEQLDLELTEAGYGSLISLPLSHAASAKALAHAATRGHMKALTGALKAVRAARLDTKVGDLTRTLVVVESEELLLGQKRGIAVALRKAKTELNKLVRRAAAGRITRGALEARVRKVLAREHLSVFVTTAIHGSDEAPTLSWSVDVARRRELERTRLGRRVLCTDRASWSTERIVSAFRGQWNVEELFRRAKKGGLVPWGPSFQRADASLRLHTFSTVLGLTLAALAKLALGSKQSARTVMKDLAAIEATLVRTSTGKKGRPPTVMLAPALSKTQLRAVQVFELDRWMPSLLSTS
jgi:transposase